MPALARGSCFSSLPGTVMVFSTIRRTPRQRTAAFQAVSLPAWLRCGSCFSSSPVPGWKFPCIRRMPRQSQRMLFALRFVGMAQMRRGAVRMFFFERPFNLLLVENIYTGYNISDISAVPWFIPEERNCSEINQSFCQSFPSAAPFQNQFHSQLCALFWNGTAKEKSCVK